jgi:Fic family protein
MKRKTGTYRIIGSNRYFIPTPLSEMEPPFEFTQKIALLYGQAMLELGKINEMSYRLPNINRFIKAYIIKEALLTSDIEGVHTTLVDVFTTPLFEEKADKNTQLVVNYTHALNVALDLMRNKNLPVVSRVLLAAHKELMSAGQGDTANPGNYRKQSVRVGAHVPPPAPEISRLMSELEHFINENDTLPPLIKAGLAHVQFETIHPFLDGNGRIGRLLIILMLLQDEVLHDPIIYISYYLKKEQYKYYQLLDETRSEGIFENWIEFFLQGIIASCKDAYKRALDIEELENNLIEQIKNEKSIVRSKEACVAALSILFAQPVITTTELAARLEKSFNTAQSIISIFVTMGILIEQTEQKRNKVFNFIQYLALLEKDYD